MSKAVTSIDYCYETTFEVPVPVLLSSELGIEAASSLLHHIAALNYRCKIDLSNRETNHKGLDLSSSSSLYNLLLQYSADPSVVDSEGYTALMSTSFDCCEKNSDFATSIRDTAMHE